MKPILKPQQIACSALLALALSGCGGSGSSQDGNNRGETAVDSVEIPRNSLIGSWRNELRFNCAERYDFGKNGVVRKYSAEEELEANYIIFSTGEARDQISFEVLGDNGKRDCYGDIRDTTGEILGPFFMEFLPGGVGLYYTDIASEPFLQMDYLEQDLSQRSVDDVSLEVVQFYPDAVALGIETQFTATLYVETDVDSILRVGLNENFRDTYEVKLETELEADFQGEISFTISGVPFDWGEGSTFAMRASLEAARGSEKASLVEPIGTF